MHASAGAAGGGSSAEKEREGAYKLAAHLSNSLDSTSGSLTSLIQTLNALSPSFSHATSSSSSGADGPQHQQGQQGQDDPLAQIASILNAHLGSLTWIEGSTEQLRRAVRDLEARVAGVQGRAAAQGGMGTPARLGASVGGGGGGRASPFARRA